MITRKATTQVTVVTGLVTNHQFYFPSQNKYLSSFAIENFKTNLYAQGGCGREGGITGNISCQVGCEHLYFVFYDLKSIFRLFVRGKDTVEHPPGHDFSFLMNL